MKKLLFVFAIAAVGSLASCKKDYTCTCTSEGGGVSVTNSTTIENAKKSDAEETCDKGDGKVGEITTTCELE